MQMLETIEKGRLNESFALSADKSRLVALTPTQAARLQFIDGVMNNIVNGSRLAAALKTEQSRRSQVDAEFTILVRKLHGDAATDEMVRAAVQKYEAHLAQLREKKAAPGTSEPILQERPPRYVGIRGGIRIAEDRAAG